MRSMWGERRRITQVSTRSCYDYLPPVSGVGPGHISRDASSKGRIVQGTHRSRDASFKGRIVQGTHRPRDEPFKGRIVQGTHRSRDVCFQKNRTGNCTYGDASSWHQNMQLWDDRDCQNLKKSSSQVVKENNTITVYVNLKSENSQEYARNLNKIVRSWIRLLF